MSIALILRWTNRNGPFVGGQSCGTKLLCQDAEMQWNKTNKEVAINNI